MAAIQDLNRIASLVLRLPSLLACQKREGAGLCSLRHRSQSAHFLSLSQVCRLLGLRNGIGKGLALSFFDRFERAGVGCFKDLELGAHQSRIAENFFREKV